MKISSNKRFVTEEFPEAIRSWIGKLISPLNSFIEQVYQTLSKNMTLADNLKAQLYQVSITANQTYPVKQAYNLNERPTVVAIGQIHENPTETSPLPVHCMTWVYSNGTLELTFIGLDAAKAYKATIYTLV
jgi:hypothetical protein